MSDIKSRIYTSGSQGISFSELIEKPTRPAIVVTFLALLELIKDHHILVKQESIQSDISIIAIDNGQEEKQGSDE